MNKTLLNTFLFLFGIFSPILLMSQYVKGIVTDESGNPIPYASVYKVNSSYGVATDQQGKYFLELNKGDHQLTFSSIGYKSITKNVSINQTQPLILNIVLLTAATELEVAEVKTNSRDRAKEIMSLVRDKRSYYLNNVEQFKRETYTKLTLEKKRVKGLAHDSIREALGQSDSLLKKNLHLTESISKIYFENPSKYREEIVAFHDHAEMPDVNFGKSISFSVEVGEQNIVPSHRYERNEFIIYEGENSADFNFYKSSIDFPRVTDKPLLSPIGIGSGLSYRYDYDGFFYEDNEKIHKILVTPLFDSEALFQGKLFIEEGTWALKAVDLEINPRVLLICSDFHIIQQYEDLGNEQFVTTRREVTYTMRDGVNDIIGKTRMMNSDYDLNEGFPKGAKKLEIKNFAVDAFDKDSLYWSGKRTLELERHELEFIHENDSLANYYESDEFYWKQDSVFNRVDWWTPLAGYGHRNRAKGNEFYIEGLPSQVNPVGIGGYRHRLPGHFKKTFENDFLFETDGFIDYGFGNNDVKAKIGVGLTYIPEKFVRTFVRFGDYYELINNYTSVEQIFSRSNYVRTKTFSVAQRMELMNGLFGELTIGYQDQLPLTGLNFAEWSNQLFGELNEPAEFERYIKTEIQLQFDYQINQKYMVKKGKKILLDSHDPKIKAIYRKGVPGLFGSEVDFDFVEVSVEHQTALARLGDLHWKISGGAYVNNTNLRLLEHKYFRRSDTYFFSDPVNSLQLLDTTLHTPNDFYTANMIHHFNGTILNKVPLINRLKLGIVGGGGLLSIPNSNYYQGEVFAGLERTFRIKQELIKFGFFAVASDSSIDPANLRFKFGINFFNPFKNRWDY